MTARLAALAAVAALCSPACGTGASTPIAGRPASPPPPRTLQLNAPGASVNVDDHVLPGFVTVIDFWAEHCGSCVVGDGFTPVAEAYDSSEVVILDGNNNLWHDWLDASGGDHQFQRIGDATNKGLQLAVAPFPDGRLDVYMIGLDARPWHMWQTIASSSGSPGGTWKVNPGSNFYPIGSDAVTALAPVRLFDGHADVFVVP